MDPAQNTIIAKIDTMLKSQKSKQLEEDRKYVESLPKEFIGFLKERQIQVQELLFGIPRYVRVKPGVGVHVGGIVQSLGIKDTQIVQVDHQFYALAPQIKINFSKYYQQAILYGMDYSSCIPARALQAKPNHKILELCSAPGNKSMYLADTVEGVEITGVEISVNRANVMRNLVRKYGLEGKIKVEVGDAVTFDTEIRYDRVLIDAECTHEGSIKHLKKFLPESSTSPPLKKSQIKSSKSSTLSLSSQQQKQFTQNNSNPYTSQIKKPNQWSSQDFKQRFLDQKKLSNLNELQMGLIENGYRLLKDGGLMVYSTCSFDWRQNQGIVEEFLGKTQAEIVDCKVGLDCAVEFQVSKIKECIRFKPSVSRCGGMFISKFRKPNPQQPQQNP